MRASGAETGVALHAARGLGQPDGRVRECGRGEQVLPALRGQRPQPLVDEARSDSGRGRG